MIIGISGKLNSGKDTVALMIQYLTEFRVKEDMSFGAYQDLYSTYLSHPWETKRFADKLKDMVCLLLGCTREELENREFKEKPLEGDWECWEVTWSDATESANGVKLFATLDEALAWQRERPNKRMYPEPRPITPRLLMQLIGTEGGRDLLHPNVWVNALMAEYKPTYEEVYGVYNNIPKTEEEKEFFREEKENWGQGCNWLIPDTRFPNEAEAIKNRDGLLIRVERPQLTHEIRYPHPSETALDEYSNFDYTIANDGTLHDLLGKVEVILDKEGIL